jgi:hypothetical protein
MLGPADDVWAHAPIRVPAVTQVEKRWRHSNDASTDVNTPATCTSRVRQYAQQWRGKWRLQGAGGGRTRSADLNPRLLNDALSTAERV